MEFAFLPNWLLIRLVRDPQSRVHWNVILSHVVLAVLVASPLLALSCHVPHFCLMKRYLGCPCPGCGITTSLLHLARGDCAASLSVNFAGIILVAGMVLQVVLHGLALCVNAIRRRSGNVSGWMNFLTLAALAISWTVQLLRMSL